MKRPSFVSSRFLLTEPVVFEIWFLDIWKIYCRVLHPIEVNYIFVAAKHDIEYLDEYGRMSSESKAIFRKEETYDKEEKLKQWESALARFDA